MKKLILILAILGVLLICSGQAGAQTWYPANQKTIAWDPVTKKTDGTNLPAADVIKYQVWSKVGVGAPVKVGGEITATQYTLSFQAEGRYIVGVQAIRYPSGEQTGQPSGITWSNATNEEDVPEPFGLVYFVASQNPMNLRPLD